MIDELFLNPELFVSLESIKTENVINEMFEWLQAQNIKVFGTQEYLFFPLNEDRVTFMLTWASELE